MKLKHILAIILLICIFVLSGCNAENPDFDETVNTTDTDSSADETTNPTTETKPETNDELFEYIISKWKQNRAVDLYEYADSELTSLLNINDFTYLFDSVSKIGGQLNNFSDKQANTSDGIVTYTAILDFENITADLSISFRNLKICDFTRNVYFKNTFEISHDNGVVEKYFVLENDGYNLNAVYTYINDGKTHPAALLIAGSGPSDYNETIGIITPFEDIALGLAQNGINSLRVDKRTFNYASEFDVKSGIEEEYIADCKAAIDFLKGQNLSELYLLGHSLGGQIATELASNNDDIDGIILFNSSARHLADIACDQYVALDPSNKAAYISYANAAKAATASTAKGYYYYSASDYYWASYNQIDTAKNISDANVKTLIINSESDNQSFEDDINMWETLFNNTKNISICVYDDISHFGYKIDTTDPSSIYKQNDFPTEIISAFSDFIKGKS